MVALPQGQIMFIICRLRRLFGLEPRRGNAERWMMAARKGESVRFSGDDRFVTVVHRKSMTQADVARVHAALSNAADQTGAFRSVSYGRQSNRIFPKTK
ncbi:MAG: hypothetical protein PGN34_16125 [Methylobacterium frigidaeris]